MLDILPNKTTSATIARPYKTDPLLFIRMSSANFCRSGEASSYMITKI